MNIKSNIIRIGIVLTILVLTGCEKDFLERALKTRLTYEDIIRRDNLKSYGMDAYKYLRQWTALGSSAMLAAGCDEADFVDNTATVQRFNTGGWNQFTNPDEVMSWYYRGIVQTLGFIKNSEDYARIFVNDTLTINTKLGYLRDCDDMFKLRAENHFLRAWFYFELVKRYGGVPILTEPIDLNASKFPQRNTIDECITYILQEIDIAYPDLIDHWVNYDMPNGANSKIGTGRGSVTGSTDVSRLGRVEKVAAKAFKLRVLLYAASPLFNPSGDVTKWQTAAAAGQDFMVDPDLVWWRYLWTSYEQIFNDADQQLLTSRKGKNSGIIFTVPFDAAYSTSIFERWNYPIGIPNGGTNVTAPSQNLVDAFEVKVNATTSVPFDWSNPVHAANPYSPTGTLGRDPRLKFIVGVNGDIYGKAVGGVNRAIQSYIGGTDAIGAKAGATTTGYYLKKIGRTDFDLSASPTTIKSFPLMRYAEVLLNFAEAMNEAYGPDAKPVIGGVAAVYSAREAVNLVRNRTGVAMPAYPLGLTQSVMRDKIFNERRVEMAFEEQRFFDVRRWKIAETTENLPLIGIRVVSTNPPTNTTFTYERFVVEQRTFDKDKMYLYPITESQVLINGWQQNPNW
jgi:starch-binding outer membrane protein, SusD/RagB family